MNPLQVLENFFLNYCLEKKPLLLALSGGPDSLCLFYCLIAYREKKSFPFHIAHVDHGWRPESTDEAQQLKELASSYHVPFHSIKLDPACSTGNLEDHCRQKRYAFFKELCVKHGLQAVLVGHHADDHVETLLKRVFEGAHWSNLGGLKADSLVFGVRVLRPFLNLKKQDILQYLKHADIQPFEDSTNHSLKFLRPRLRHTILPWLNEHFGKQIDRPLNYLGMDTQELVDYFDAKLLPVLNNSQRGPFGVFIDLTHPDYHSKVEIKYLVRRFFEREGLCLSRDQIQLIAELIEKSSSNKEISTAQFSIWIDRKWIFICFKDVFQPCLTDVLIPLKEGNKRIENWNIQVSPVQDALTSTSWQGGWSGKFRAVIPYGSYQLGYARANASYNYRGVSISKWWNNHKIPSFFRSLVPVIWEGDTIIHEFMTGRIANQDRKERNLCIELERIH